MSRSGRRDAIVRATIPIANDDRSRLPESQYAHWMMKAHPDWTVLNRGIDGQTATEIRGRLARDVLSAKPAYVIILAGVNDIFGGSEAESVERELARMYADALGAGIAP